MTGIFTRSDGTQVSQESVSVEIRNFSMDLENDKIAADMPFTDYVERYCGWKYQSEKEEKK